MATYEELIRSEFPQIDDELYQYVEGILTNGADDFEDSEEVYEAIGAVLHEVSQEKTENEVKNVCEKLLGILKPGKLGLTNGSTPQKVLGAPVHLGSMAATLENNVEEMKSIWVVTRDDTLKVDLKKLEKAEAKLQQKQEKRKEAQGAKMAPVIRLETATASQVTNKKEMKMEAKGTNKTQDIRIENFDVAYGDRILLQGADLTLAFGRRYGLVGRNGLGKTTLLRMISSKQLAIPSHISVLHVEQEVVGDDTIALESVLESDTVRTQLLKEEKDLVSQLNAGRSNEAHIGSRLSEVYSRLQNIEADKAPARASIILNGLGFTREMQGRATKTFSGGWRMRLALARALFSRPDLLLLDEPTNMLDIKAIIWLENYLQNWPTTLLVVSHDRNFLETVPTDILHLHSQRIESYRGNYSTFEKTKTDKLKSQQREFEAQQQHRAHVQEFIDRFRYNANRASSVQSKIKMLEKFLEVLQTVKWKLVRNFASALIYAGGTRLRRLKSVPSAVPSTGLETPTYPIGVTVRPDLKPVEKETEVVLKFPEADALSPPILQLSEVFFSYSPNNVIFSNVNLSATLESRICIVGENGAGKTTLLKIIMGMLVPSKGIRHVHRNLKFGYFSQHHVDQLDMAQNSIELLQAAFPGRRAEEYRRQLGSFGISGDLALQQVASLSGGQKSRVAFARMCMGNPNFLVLDEPTNHLDIETIEALGKAIEKYTGGVILVSHDERLIRMVCKELWVCHGGNVKAVEGGFDEYRKLIEKEIEALSD